MPTKEKKPEKIIVVGAGVSGATAARQLAKQLNKEPSEITVLEIKDEVGGKLKTFHHPNHPELVTEFGAGVLTHNYPVIDVFKEKNLKTEMLLPTKYDTVDFYNEIKKHSLIGQFLYIADFAWQNVKFAKSVWDYNRACERLDEKPPQDQELPFAEYLTKHKLDKVATFLKFLWPGFGYGLFEDKNNYTFRVLNYMGYTTMLSIALGRGLLTIHGGYQQLVEKMLEGFNVKTSAQIQKIERDAAKFTVVYQQNNQTFELEGDLLVLACSPYFWKDLGMPLTASEQACVDNLAYYRYPTVICRVKGLNPEQLFFLDALEERGFGRPAFLFTRDNRKNLDEENDGRLCTIYINLPEGKNDFNLEPDSTWLKILEDELRKIPGVTDVAIDATHIWPDYNPSVPWETGIALQKEEAEHYLRTLHIGTYLPGSFETVGAASEYAIEAVNKWLNVHVSYLQSGLTSLRRAFEFFTAPNQKPAEGQPNQTSLEPEELRSRTELGAMQYRH